MNCATAAGRLGYRRMYDSRSMISKPIGRTPATSISCTAGACTARSKTGLALSNKPSSKQPPFLQASVFARKKEDVLLQRSHELMIPCAGISSQVATLSSRTAISSGGRQTTPWPARRLRRSTTSFSTPAMPRAWIRALGRARRSGSGMLALRMCTPQV